VTIHARGIIRGTWTGSRVEGAGPLGERSFNVESRTRGERSSDLHTARRGSSLPPPAPSRWVGTGTWLRPCAAHSEEAQRGILSPAETFMEVLLSTRRSRSWMIWVPFLFVVIFLYAVLRSWLLTCIVIFLGTAWLAFQKRTYCDVENKTDGQPCSNPVRGKLRACRRHRRQKRDAIWAYLGLTNPGQRFRIMWARATGQPANITPRPAEATPQVLDPLYHVVILIATVASALAAVIGITFQVAAS
jgi:hypothetical protein